MDIKNGVNAIRDLVQQGFLTSRIHVRSPETKHIIGDYNDIGDVPYSIWDWSIEEKITVGLDDIEIYYIITDFRDD